MLDKWLRGLTGGKKLPAEVDGYLGKLGDVDWSKAISDGISKMSKGGTPTKPKSSIKAGEMIAGPTHWGSMAPKSEQKRLLLESTAKKKF